MGRGWRKECVCIEDPVAPASRWVRSLYSSSPSLSLSFSLSLENCLPAAMGAAPLLSSVFPHSLFSPTISPADRANGGRDGRCPLRVRQHFLSVPEARSGGIRGRPVLVPFQCLWGPFTVSTHPSHDPHIGCSGLVQTGADHAAPSLQYLHSGRATEAN